MNQRPHIRTSKRGRKFRAGRGIKKIKRARLLEVPTFKYDTEKLNEARQRYREDQERIKTLEQIRENKIGSKKPIFIKTVDPIVLGYEAIVAEKKTGIKKPLSEYPGLAKATMAWAIQVRPNSQPDIFIDGSPVEIKTPIGRHIPSKREVKKSELDTLQSQLDIARRNEDIDAIKYLESQLK